MCTRNDAAAESSSVHVTTSRQTHRWLGTAALLVGVYGQPSARCNALPFRRLCRDLNSRLCRRLTNQRPPMRGGGGIGRLSSCEQSPASAPLKIVARTRLRGGRAHHGSWEACYNRVRAYRWWRWAARNNCQPAGSCPSHTPTHPRPFQGHARGSSAHTHNPCRRARARVRTLLCTFCTCATLPPTTRSPTAPLPIQPPPRPRARAGACYSPAAAASSPPLTHSLLKQSQGRPLARQRYGLATLHPRLPPQLLLFSP